MIFVIKYDKFFVMKYNKLFVMKYNKFFVMKYDKFFVMIFDDSKFSTNNILMRYRRICFIFALLNFFH